MCEQRFIRLESEFSLSRDSVARIQADMSEAKTQIRRLQTELDCMKSSMANLRNEVRRDYIPWDVMYRRCERFLNICALGMAAVVVFALAHGFKWI